MTLALQESAGVSGNVDFINVKPVTEAGIELSTLGYGADVIVERSGTNHVSAGGTFSFPLTILYSTGTSSAGLTVTISLQFTDDLGNQIAATVEVQVL
jgi:hypothetical protein